MWCSWNWNRENWKSNWVFAWIMKRCCTNVRTRCGWMNHLLFTHQRLQCDQLPMFHFVDRLTYCDATERMECMPNCWISYAFRFAMAVHSFQIDLYFRTGKLNCGMPLRADSIYSLKIFVNFLAIICTLDFWIKKEQKHQSKAPSSIPTGIAAIFAALKRNDKCQIDDSCCERTCLCTILLLLRLSNVKAACSMYTFYTRFIACTYLRLILCEYLIRKVCNWWLSWTENYVASKCEGHEKTLAKANEWSSQEKW